MIPTRSARGIALPCRAPSPSGDRPRAGTEILSPSRGRAPVDRRRSQPNLERNVASAPTRRDLFTSIGLISDRVANPKAIFRFSSASLRHELPVLNTVPDRRKGTAGSGTSRSGPDRPPRDRREGDVGHVPTGGGYRPRRGGARYGKRTAASFSSHVLPCELDQGGASQRALYVPERLVSAWLACRWISRTTSVRNPCQARNDSGSLTPRPTGSVTDFLLERGGSGLFFFIIAVFDRDF
jgi:hypothetical protein